MELTDENFEEHFFDVRKHPRPKKGQVMARFTSMADLVEGRLKKDVIYLLTKVDGGGRSAAQVMRKLACAIEIDSYRIPREISEDLLNGMTEEEVEKKSYKYQLEAFYFTNRDIVPCNEHWSIVEILNKESFQEE